MRCLRSTCPAVRGATGSRDGNTATAATKDDVTNLGCVTSVRATGDGVPEQDLLRGNGASDEDAWLALVVLESALRFHMSGGQALAWHCPSSKPMATRKATHRKHVTAHAMRRRLFRQTPRNLYLGEVAGHSRFEANRSRQARSMPWSEPHVRSEERRPNNPARITEGPPQAKNNPRQRFDAARLSLETLPWRHAARHSGGPWRPSTRGTTCCRGIRGCCRTVAGWKSKRD